MELRGRIRDAQAVVARGRGDDTGGAALGRHAHELVQRAADLEGANGLDRLELEMNLAAGLVGEGARVLQWRRLEVRREVARRPLDVRRAYFFLGLRLSARCRASFFRPGLTDTTFGPRTLRSRALA